jgi:hypothetical protein
MIKNKLIFVLLTAFCYSKFLFAMDNQKKESTKKESICNRFCKKNNPSDDSKQQTNHRHYKVLKGSIQGEPVQIIALDSTDNDRICCCTLVGCLCNCAILYMGLKKEKFL